MKRVRTVLFWCHLTAGVIAGLVILVMSATGAALALKPQILNYVERDVRFVTPGTGPQLSSGAILTAVKEARPDASPASISRDRNPAAAATVNLGTAGNVFVNPYTGAILGTGSARANQIFQSLTTWHRYMGASGDSRPLGKSATGMSNLAFLVLAVTGLYIWWPAQLSIRHLKPITWFRRTTTGRARDFNWHNTIGFWSLPAIVIMTVSGAVISYPWASNLVYRLTGSPIPVARAAAPAAGPAAQEGRGRAGSQSAEARGETALPPARIDEVWARAEQQVPTWSIIALRLPTQAGGASSFTITDGAQWNKFARSTLTVNSATAEVTAWQAYESGSLGQKVRGWLRFAHTGELGGLAGQIVAGFGCLGGVMLVYTGIALAFRRLWNWSLWSRIRGLAPAPVVRVEPRRVEMARQTAVDID